VSEMYQALYPPEGGTPQGFRCRQPDCKGIARTEKGIRSHLKQAHGLVAQGVLFDVDPIRPPKTAKGKRK
jgi:hypothetical protein